jgi:cytochrome o ubiquinol oxidase subunit IV
MSVKAKKRAAGQGLHQVDHISDVGAPESLGQGAIENVDQADSYINLSSYLAGFTISLCVTLTAYILVINHLFSRRLLIAAVAGLALVQFMTQLLFFLHLCRETKPRWKLGVFLFMIMVVLILVFGSIWIMSNLNYHHDQLMTPSAVNNYMNDQDGL